MNIPTYKEHLSLGSYLYVIIIKVLRNVGYNTDFGFLPQDLIPFYITFPNLMHVSKNREGYNLIIVGTPKANPLLEEVYAVADVTRVAEGYPEKVIKIGELRRH